MIAISDTDRDKAVAFLKAYAALLQGIGRTTRQANDRRMALNLAAKLGRKQPAATNNQTR